MLIDKIDTVDIDKIFCNSKNKKTYIKEVFKRKNKRTPQLSKLKRGELNKIIADNWIYDESKKIIRKMFKETDKYKYQKKCKIKLNKALGECIRIFGDVEWPFSATEIDEYVHALNREENLSELAKDEKLSKDMIKFRRVKDINMLRNDYIEFLIFKNKNVIPTLGNKAGIDYYINGESYDQKVSRSVGKEFVKKHGKEYKEIAIAHPEWVAQSLYKNQDESRFGDEPRLLIVYLDNNISADAIKSQLSNIDFNTPYEISFDYKHSNNKILNHKTKCFVILLHN